MNCKLRKIVKIVCITSTFTGSLYLLHKNNYLLYNNGLIRFCRVGVAASATFIDYKWSLHGNFSKSEYSSKLKECHLRGAHRILDVAKKNGGVFIKVGQHIASLQYLLPEEYTKTFAILQSNAPESNYEEIKIVFRKNLKQDVEEVFSSFSKKPCGAASLGQVHKAVLRETGDLVAVKIQHPKVKDCSFVDIATMEFFMRCANLIFPKFRLMWLLDETKRNLPKELDFLNEASNSEKARKIFAHLTFLKVPKIYYNLSTSEVLTMEFCDGGQIDDLNYFEKQNINKNNIFSNLGKLYSEMIFLNGYIHCDPHPGNILVRRNKSGKEEIVLLDHGLYANLDENLRINYSQLWLALIKSDKKKIKKICTKMGIGDYYDLFACIVTLRSWESIIQGINKVQFDKAEQFKIKEYATSLIPQISTVLDKMPRQLLLILKTNDLLRSIAYKLNSENNTKSFVEMTRCCTRTVYLNKIRKTNFIRKKIFYNIKMYILLTKINIYEKYLFALDLFKSVLF